MINPIGGTQVLMESLQYFLVGMLLRCMAWQLTSPFLTVFNLLASTSVDSRMTGSNEPFRIRSVALDVPCSRPVCETPAINFSRLMLRLSQLTKCRILCLSPSPTNTPILCLPSLKEGTHDRLSITRLVRRYKLAHHLWNSFFQFCTNDTGLTTSTFPILTIGIGS
jgi:hypothetical protein